MANYDNYYNVDKRYLYNTKDGKVVGVNSNFYTTNRDQKVRDEDIADDPAGGCKIVSNIESGCWRILGSAYDPSIELATQEKEWGSVVKLSFNQVVELFLNGNLIVEELETAIKDKGGQNFKSVQDGDMTVVTFTYQNKAYTLNCMTEACKSQLDDITDKGTMDVKDIEVSVSNDVEDDEDDNTIDNQVTGSNETNAQEELSEADQKILDSRDYKEAKAGIILLNYLNNVNLSSNSVESLLDPSVVQLPESTFNLRTFKLYKDTILYYIDRNGGISKLKDQAVTKLLDDFSKGNIAYTQAMEILSQIGIDVKENNTDSVYNLSFEYKGKKYEVSCDKKAAQKGTDKNVVNLYSMESINTITTNKKLIEEYFEPTVKIDGQATAYAIKSGKKLSDLKSAATANLKAEGLAAAEQRQSKSVYNGHVTDNGVGHSNTIYSPGGYISFRVQGDNYQGSHAPESPTAKTKKIMEEHNLYERFGDCPSAMYIYYDYTYVIPNIAELLGISYEEAEAKYTQKTFTDDEVILINHNCGTVGLQITTYGQDSSYNYGINMQISTNGGGSFTKWVKENYNIPTATDVYIDYLNDFRWDILNNNTEYHRFNHNKTSVLFEVVDDYKIKFTEDSVDVLFEEIKNNLDYIKPSYPYYGNASFILLAINMGITKDDFYNAPDAKQYVADMMTKWCYTTGSEDGKTIYLEDAYLATTNNTLEEMQEWDRKQELNLKFVERLNEAGYFDAETYRHNGLLKSVSFAESYSGFDSEEEFLKQYGSILKTETKTINDTPINTRQPASSQYVASDYGSDAAVANNEVAVEETQSRTSTPNPDLKVEEYQPRETLSAQQIAKLRQNINDKLDVIRYDLYKKYFHYDEKLMSQYYNFDGVIPTGWKSEEIRAQVAKEMENLMQTILNEFGDVIRTLTYDNGRIIYSTIYDCDESIYLTGYMENRGMPCNVPANDDTGFSFGPAAFPPVFDTPVIFKAPEFYKTTVPDGVPVDGDKEILETSIKGVCIAKDGSYAYIWNTIKNCYDKVKTNTTGGINVSNENDIAGFINQPLNKMASLIGHDIYTRVISLAQGCDYTTDGFVMAKDGEFYIYYTGSIMNPEIGEYMVDYVKDSLGHHNRPMIKAKLYDGPGNESAKAYANSASSKPANAPSAPANAPSAPTTPANAPAVNGLIDDDDEEDYGDDLDNDLEVDDIDGNVTEEYLSALEKLEEVCTTYCDTLIAALEDAYKTGKNYAGIFDFSDYNYSEEGAVLLDNALNTVYSLLNDYLDQEAEPTLEGFKTSLSAKLDIIISTALKDEFIETADESEEMPEVVYSSKTVFATMKKAAQRNGLIATSKKGVYMKNGKRYIWDPQSGQFRRYNKTTGTKFIRALTQAYNNGYNFTANYPWVCEKDGVYYTFDEKQGIFVAKN